MLFSQQISNMELVTSEVTESNMHPHVLRRAASQGLVEGGLQKVKSRLRPYCGFGQQLAQQSTLHGTCALLFRSAL